MIAVRRILCPFDFSEVSRRTLEHAAALARAFGSRLVRGLHVAPPLMAPVAPYAAPR